MLATSAPEIRTQFLIHDMLVGVVRTGHSLLAGDGVTAERYAACQHVVASREGHFAEAVDGVLEGLGLRRTVMVVVPGYPDAMRIARRSDLVALVPRSCLGRAMLPGDAADPGLESFELPFAMPELTILAMWHPRMDADPAHRWLREIVMSVCRAAYPR